MRLRNGRTRRLPERGAVTVRCNATSPVPAVTTVACGVSSVRRLAGRLRHGVAERRRARGRMALSGLGSCKRLCWERIGAGVVSSPLQESVHSSITDCARTGKNRAGGMAASDFPQQRSLGFTPASAVSSHVREHTRWDGLAETGWPPRPPSAERRFKGTRDSRIAKRTVLRESPFMRSLSGARMLHHHSSRRKARAVTALRRRPVDRGAPPSSEGTQ